MPIRDHARPLQRYQAFLDHLVQLGKKLGDSLGVVDDFDNDGQVFRKAKDFGRVDAAVRAEAHDAAQNGCAGHAPPPGFEHDRLVQRFALVMVALADKDSQQFGFFGQSNGMSLL
jgi:hypothetical protein